MALPTEIREDTSELLPFDRYDHVIVSFSGGKDSLACVLYALELGIPKEKIELWHQAVDGKPGVDPRFFDWPCTESYCRDVARVLGLPIKFQWRDGGFEREINKQDAPTAKIGFELPDGSIGQAGGTGEPNTRLMFPAAVADLRTRWCSAILKIDVATSAINNDPRFKVGKILEITGERRQESNNRARYAEVEKHKSTTQSRRVDQWRAIIDWPEERVWEIIQRWGIRAHPAYHLGWGRVSCMFCIFGNPDQWASANAVNPRMFWRILNYERQFGRTIQQGGDIEHLASKGKSYVPDDPEMIRIAMSDEVPHGYAQAGAAWTMPFGAFKRSGGPL